jgi:cytochrome P450
MMEYQKIANWLPNDTHSLILSLAALSVIYWVASTLYDAYFGPLSKFPGPKLNAISVLPTVVMTYTGHDNIDIPALHAKYGPVVRTSPKDLSYTGAAAFKDIYGFGKKGLYKDPHFYMKPLNDVHSLISADDAGHSRQRKVLSNSFSDRALKEQEPLLKHWVELMKDKMLASAKAGKKADLLKFYNCTTFVSNTFYLNSLSMFFFCFGDDFLFAVAKLTEQDIMGDLCFAESLDMLKESEYSPWVKVIFEGIKAGARLRSIRMLSNLTDYLIRDWLFQMEFVRAKQWEHWNYSKERVDRRLARTPDRPDLWTKILEKGAPDDANGLSLGEHHSTASLFMIAGTETTATALSGTTYHLLMNPDKLDLLQREIRSAFTSLDDMNLESLARQKYLMAVLQEGLRMYPPVPSALPRKVPAGGAEICGEWVPGGTTVGVHHLSTYRDPECFRKPYEFHPERWLGDPEFKDDKLSALEPFSVGPRNCLGKVS